MDYQNQNYGYPAYDQQQAVVEQTNAVMRRVYVRMFIGILISAFCALGVATSPTLREFLFGNIIIFWGMFIVMIAMAWILPSRLHKMSTGTALLLFCIFSALMGTSLAPIFLVYQLGTIAYTFFITAGVFGAMSVYGYLTKTDLTKIGSYLMMALFGLIILSIVNIFLASSAMDWWISILGVVIFIGLTAWDTQTAKKLATMNMDPAMRDKLATLCALNLYLDFINLFLYLLRLFVGNRN
jgi:hypothetical protein